MTWQVCANCGADFDRIRGRTQICKSCRTVECETCGTPFQTRGDNLERRFCSKRCIRHDLVNWKSRFLPKIQRDFECWEWQGKRGRHGYGRFKIKGKEYFAHRLAYELEYGPVPEGMGVLHHCDNPPCCNPSHLFIGTQADNVSDMMNKERDLEGREKAKRLGEQHHKARLTEVDVRAIREQRANGRICREIAADFGVTREAVQSIVDRRSWKHI